MYNWVCFQFTLLTDSSPGQGRCSVWSACDPRRVACCVVYLFTVSVSHLPEVGPPGWITVTLHTQGLHVHAGGRSPRSLDSAVHKRRKTFSRPLSQRRRDGVLLPCQFISAALTMTYLQYMTFSDTKGWIDLTVSVKGMDGREAGLRHRGLEALRKNTFSN